MNDTIQKMQRLDGRLGPLRIPERCLPNGKNSNWIALLEEWYGIKYLAPCDARNTHLAAGSVDFITSTATLEHIPASDIALILRECTRLLKRGGGASFIIDYQDHYSYFDDEICYYNFLEYSPFLWELHNAPLHFQNRLRHRDYRELFGRSGFEIDVEEPVEPTSADLERIHQLSIHPSFSSRFTVDELAIRGALYVLRRQGIRDADAFAIGPEAKREKETGQPVA